MLFGLRSLQWAGVEGAKAHRRESGALVGRGGVVATALPPCPEKYSFRKNGFECDQGCNADDSGTGPSKFRLQNTATKTTSCLRVAQEVTHCHPLACGSLPSVTKNNTGQWRRRRQLLKDRERPDVTALGTACLRDMQLMNKGSRTAPNCTECARLLCTSDSTRCMRCIALMVYFSAASAVAHRGRQS